MSVVEPDRVGALEPGHSGHQVRFRSFDHQVVVVGHQAVRMHLPARLLAGLGQGLDEIMPIHIIQEDLIPAVATAHEMIDCTLDLPKSIWHAVPMKRTAFS